MANAPFWAAGGEPHTDRRRRRRSRASRPPSVGGRGRHYADIEFWAQLLQLRVFGEPAAPRLALPKCERGTAERCLEQRLRTLSCGARGALNAC